MRGAWRLQETEQSIPSLKNGAKEERMRFRTTEKLRKWGTIFNSEDDIKEIEFLETMKGHVNDRGDEFGTAGNGMLKFTDCVNKFGCGEGNGGDFRAFGQIGSRGGQNLQKAGHLGIVFCEDKWSGRSAICGLTF
jgi:hypothetical protein